MHVDEGLTLSGVASCIDVPPPSSAPLKHAVFFMPLEATIRVSRVLLVAPLTVKVIEAASATTTSSEIPLSEE